MAELKPCPFCGGEGTIDSTFDGYYACCISCHVEIRREERAEVIEAWNNRTENEELKFTREFIHEHGLEFALASAWNRRAENENKI